MSTTADLMGLGMSPALAGRLGNTPQSVAGNGTTQTGATTLAGGAVFLATPAASNTAFVLSNAISTGRPVYFWNQSASQTALIYPPSGGKINGGSTNASISVAALSGAILQLENGAGVAAESWGAIIGLGANSSPTFTNITATGSILSSGTAGVGYTTGAGGAVTQGTSRTTGVTLNAPTGAITLVSAAGSATPASFTLTNSAIAATDAIVVNQKSGTDLYEIFVTAVAAGSCKITSFTTGGTTTEQPVFNFAVIKGAAS